jgi:hypothetical protein
MRVKSVACICVAILAFAARTACAQMLVGPNLEWSYWAFPKSVFGVDNGTSVSVGGYYLSPGLRVGYLFPGAAVTALADVGIQHEAIESIKYTNIMFEPGLAYAFMSKSTTSPVVGINAGWHHVLDAGVAVTRPFVGASAGVRCRIAAGHGLIRAELRYDHFTSTDTKEFVLPQDMVGLRLGADLLLSK